jgi:tight adherence protein C
MFGLDLLLWIAPFATASLLIYGLIVYFQHRRVVRDRCKRASTTAIPVFNREAMEDSFKKRFLEWLSSLGKWGSREKEDASQMRSTLIQAGFRHPKGPGIFFGIRALMAISLPIPYLLFIVIDGNMSYWNFICAFGLGGAGFYLPQFGLRFITRRRMDRIDKALPDVLDLFIVCMEAGLALQATINRVADEVRHISMDLYNEFQLTNAELRTGIPREVALKSLGERTGVQNVKALVGLMIQSERMGTSISQALRTHAAFLRVQRGLKAEEKAAKLPVKILFPMMFFIFPAIFVVVLGPAVIQMSRSSFFAG